MAENLFDIATKMSIAVFLPNFTLFEVYFHTGCQNVSLTLTLIIFTPIVTGFFFLITRELQVEAFHYIQYLKLLELSLFQFVKIVKKTP